MHPRWLRRILRLQSIGYYLTTDLDLEFQEGLPIDIGNGNFERRPCNPYREGAAQFLPMVLRNIHLSVDSFLAHVNAAQQSSTSTFKEHRGAFGDHR